MLWCSLSNQFSSPDFLLECRQTKPGRISASFLYRSSKPIGGYEVWMEPEVGFRKVSIRACPTEFSKKTFGAANCTKKSDVLHRFDSPPPPPPVFQLQIGYTAPSTLPCCSLRDLFFSPATNEPIGNLWIDRLNIAPEGWEEIIIMLALQLSACLFMCFSSLTKTYGHYKKEATTTILPSLMSGMKQEAVLRHA